MLQQYRRYYLFLLRSCLYRRARFGHAFVGWRLPLRIRLRWERVRTCRWMVRRVVELLYLDLRRFVR